MHALRCVPSPAVRLCLMHFTPTATHTGCCVDPHLSAISGHAASTRAFKVVHDAECAFSELHCIMFHARDAPVASRMLTRIRRLRRDSRKDVGRHVAVRGSRVGMWRDIETDGGLVGALSPVDSDLRIRHSVAPALTCQATVVEYASADMARFPPRSVKLR